MKNQECSRLTKEYNAQVKEYNQLVNRVIRNKYEMSYLWKYKNDYPADWKRKAEMLTDDRNKIWELQNNIIALKAAIRKCNSEHPQENPEVKE